MITYENTKTVYDLVENAGKEYGDKVFLRYEDNDVVYDVTYGEFVAKCHAVAAWTAYGKLDGLYWMMINAFGVSITTFVGQNFGAGKYDRMRRSVRVCLLMTFGATVLMSGFFREIAAFLDGVAEACAGVPGERRSPGSRTLSTLRSRTSFIAPRTAPTSVPVATSEVPSSRAMRSTSSKSPTLRLVSVIERL